MERSRGLAESRAVSVDDNVAAVRDFVDRAWNAGDEAAFEEHLAPDFGGIAIDVMRNGVRVQGWAEIDRLGLLTQLGAMEGPPSA